VAAEVAGCGVNQVPIRVAEAEGRQGMFESRILVQIDFTSQPV